MILFLCIISFELLLLIQGLEISSKFVSGDVIFNWGHSPGPSEFDVLITLDNVSSSWTLVNDTQYTVRNALLHKAINIRIRSLEQEESERTFKVSKVKTQIRNNVNITWIAPYFPSSGFYHVYHTYQVNSSIFNIKSSGVQYHEKDRHLTKYNYLTRPYDSTNIAFMIRNTTLEDAGYYAGGVSSDAAWMEGGVVLIVLAVSNLALKKPAKQSSTWVEETSSANFAVDGNNGTDFIVDKCTHTGDGDTNPWWLVDLQADYFIKSVRIFNRGMDIHGIDTSDRLRNVTVTVGRTESDVNTPCGVFAGPGTLSQLVVDIGCSSVPKGRFVKIAKTTLALTLCEVEVFGYSA